MSFKLNRKNNSLDKAADTTLDSADNIKMLPVVVKLAWPTMLEQLLQTAVQYIDIAMVGALGTAATAAVGCTSTVSWLVGSTISAVGVGYLAYISQAIGAKKPEMARRASGQAVTAVLVLGIFFTLITTLLSGFIPVWMQADVSIREQASRYFLILYSPMLFRTASIIFGTVLRAAGDTRTPMLCAVGVNIINIVLNLVLIYPTRQIDLFGLQFTAYGVGMGTDGAALASAVAYTIGGIVITILLWRHKTISPAKQRLKPDFEILKPCFKVALPNMLQRFGTSFGYVVFAGMINSLGDTATAAHTIANTVESAFYIPGYGMQTAAATLAGNAWGANDKNRLNKLTRTVIPLETVLMIISGGLLFIFAPSLMSIFSDDNSVIELGAIVLRMVAVSEPFYGITIVLEGIMQGIGKTAAPFVYNITGMWGVRILGTFICTVILDYGLVAAWGCMIGHNLLLFIMFTLTVVVLKKRLQREENVPDRIEI